MFAAAPMSAWPVSICASFRFPVRRRNSARARAVRPRSLAQGPCRESGGAHHHLRRRSDRLARSCKRGRGRGQGCLEDRERRDTFAWFWRETAMRTSSLAKVQVLERHGEAGSGSRTCICGLVSRRPNRWTIPAPLSHESTRSRVGLAVIARPGPGHPDHPATPGRVLKHRTP